MEPEIKLPVVSPKTAVVAALPVLDEERAYEPPQLRNWWKAIRGRMWIVALMTTTITGGVFYLMARNPDYYDAKARVEITPERAEMSADTKGISPVFAADPTYLNTQLQIAAGSPLLRRVVKELHLERDTVYQRYLVKSGRTLRRLLRLVHIGPRHEDDFQATPLTQSLSPVATVQDLEEASRLEPTVADARQRLKVEPIRETRSAFRETRLIEVTFRHPSPNLAAKVANAVADAYVLSSREQNDKLGEMRNSVLGQRVADLQTQLQEAENNLLQYSQQHEIVSLEPGQNPVLERLLILNRDAVMAEHDRKMAEANYRAVADGNESTYLADEYAKNELSEAQTRLSALKQRKAKLLVGVTDKWPEVREISQEIATIETHLTETRERARTTALGTLKAKFAQASERERAVTLAFEREREASMKQNRASVDYRLLRQEVDTNKQILAGLLEQLGKNEVSVASAGSQARVVDYALVPDPSEPTGPWRLAYVALAALVSFGSGLGLVFLLGHLDNTVRSTEEIEGAMHLRPLAEIGSARSNLLSRAREVGPELLTSGHMPAPMAEDYRRLRTLVIMGGVKMRRILITSSQPAEGKTTTAVNLAVSLAQTGARVVIVDADMRCPRIHKIFGLDNASGLRAVLDSDMDANAMDEQVTARPEANLTVVTAGEPCDQSAELLGSPRLRQFLDRLASQFDYLVIDSPSVTSCVDSAILAAHVDGVALVVRNGKCPRDVLKYSCQVLRESGATLLGVVLNDVPQRTHRTWSYYGNRRQPT